MWLFIIIIILLSVLLSGCLIPLRWCCRSQIGNLKRSLSKRTMLDHKWRTFMRYTSADCVFVCQNDHAKTSKLEFMKLSEEVSWNPWAKEELLKYWCTFCAPFSLYGWVKKSWFKQKRAEKWVLKVVIRLQQRWELFKLKLMVTHTLLQENQ